MFEETLKKIVGKIPLTQHWSSKDNIKKNDRCNEVRAMNNNRLLAIRLKKSSYVGYITNDDKIVLIMFKNS